MPENIKKTAFISKGTLIDFIEAFCIKELVQDVKKIGKISDEQRKHLDKIQCELLLRKGKLDKDSRLESSLFTELNGKIGTLTASKENNIVPNTNNLLECIYKIQKREVEIKDEIEVQSVMEGYNTEALQRTVDKIINGTFAESDAKKAVSYLGRARKLKERFLISNDTEKVEIIDVQLDVFKNGLNIGYIATMVRANSFYRLMIERFSEIFKEANKISKQLSGMTFLLVILTLILVAGPIHKIFYGKMVFSKINEFLLNFHGIAPVLFYVVLLGVLFFLLIVLFLDRRRKSLAQQ